jgi:hypothetical protein
MSNTLSLTAMTTSDLARILFASRLQASDDPSPEQVRKAIDEGVCACDGDHVQCAAALVAQEAGDHPDAYAARMRWALRAVGRTFQSLATAA